MLSDGFLILLGNLNPLALAAHHHPVHLNSADQSAIHLVLREILPTPHIMSTQPVNTGLLSDFRSVN